MRGEFFKMLQEEMRKDEKLFLLMGDTGYNLLEPFFEEFPERSLNVGVAEQNMIGIAAGLVNVGFKPICYGITNFLVHRCLEQIRNDLCLHNYPVILVGTSTGLDNGALWATHYIVDDIACLKALPNINIYSPSSIESIEKILSEARMNQNPSFIRITKNSFSENNQNDEINRFIIENKESSILVLSHGRMISKSVEANKLYPNFSIFALDKIKPLDEKKLNSTLKRFSKIVVIEDNFNSGLFNSICQFITEQNIQTKVFSISVDNDFGNRTGNTEYLDRKFGLSVEQISNFIKKLPKD